MDGSDDSSSDDDTDMDQQARRIDPHIAALKPQPIIDDDGFQLVQSRKPGRGR